MEKRLTGCRRGGWSGGAREPRIRLGRRSPRRKGQFWGLTWGAEYLHVYMQRGFSYFGTLLLFINSIIIPPLLSFYFAPMGRERSIVKRMSVCLFTRISLVITLRVMPSVGVETCYATSNCVLRLRFSIMHPDAQVWCKLIDLTEGHNLMSTITLFVTTQSLDRCLFRIRAWKPDIPHSSGLFTCISRHFIRTKYVVIGPSHG